MYALNNFFNCAMGKMHYLKLLPALYSDNCIPLMTKRGYVSQDYVTILFFKQKYNSKSE